MNENVKSADMSSTSASASHTPSSGKEKKLSDKDLDLMNAHRGVWLVKVPKYIADRWEKVADQTEVGKLRITRRPGIKPTVAFSLDDTIVAAREPEAVKETSADKKGAAKNGSSSNGAASTSGNNGPKPFATNKQIPKEHKFVVNTVSAQTLAVSVKRIWNRCSHQRFFIVTFSPRYFLSPLQTRSCPGRSTVWP